MRSVDFWGGLGALRFWNGAHWWRSDARLGCPPIPLESRTASIQAAVGFSDAARSPTFRGLLTQVVEPQPIASTALIVNHTFGTRAN